MAAIRECFEEAGLLFATGPGGPVSFDDSLVRKRFEQHRRQLNRGATTLAAICRKEEILLTADRLRYFSHWITPEGAPRRYDTRFFLAVAPEHQDALHDAAEVVASEWVVPSEALERHRAGELDLMFPTVKHLEHLSGFTSADELWNTPGGDVATIQPRISVEGSEVRVLMPGDPGFEEAAGLPEGVAFPDRPIGSRDG